MVPLLTKIRALQKRVSVTEEQTASHGGGFLPLTPNTSGLRGRILMDCIARGQYTPLLPPRDQSGPQRHIWVTQAVLANLSPSDASNHLEGIRNQTARPAAL